VPKSSTFHEIRENVEIPRLAVTTSCRLSAMWAAAFGDFDPIHYDNEYAVRHNLPGTIVNGCRTPETSGPRTRIGWHGAMLRASEFRYADTNSKFT